MHRCIPYVTWKCYACLSIDVIQLMSRRINQWCIGTALQKSYQIQTLEDFKLEYFLMLRSLLQDTMCYSKATNFRRTYMITDWVTFYFMRKGDVNQMLWKLSNIRGRNELNLTTKSNSTLLPPYYCFCKHGAWCYTQYYWN